MRLIDADLFVAEIKKRITNAIQWGKNATKEEIKIRAEQAVATFSEASLTARKMPTVDAEPVRHGRWEVVDGAEPRRYGCSVCKKLSWTEDNYCPNCGAKMDEVGEDD